MNKRYLSLVSVIVSLIMLVAACAPAAPPAIAPTQPPAKAGETPSKAPGPPAEMKIGGVVAYDLVAPTLLSIQKGFFKEDNLDVKEFPMGPGPRVNEMLMAKETDFMDNSSLPALIAVDKGVSLKIVATVMSGGYFALWVRSDLKDKVKSVKDLKGLKLGTTGPGSGTWTTTMFYLKKAGFSEKDVEWVTISDPSPAAWLSALKTKSIDTVATWPVLVPYLQAEGLAFPLIDIHNREVLKEYIPSGNLTPMVVVTRQDVIDRNPQLVQRRVDVEKRALQFIASHSAREVAEASAPQMKMDVEIATRIMEQQRQNYSPDGRISKSGIEAEIDIAFQAGVLSKRLKYEDVVDTRFAGTVQ